MKNFYIISVALLLSLFGQLPAQTLKNIHRHNQPMLRIPTHLIDKVETSEVNGEQVLQVRQLNGYVSEIPLAQIDSITHSEGEAVDPAQLGYLRTASVMGVVTGPTGAPEMNAIVRSPYGGEETRTDPNGVFFLNNILVCDKLGYITITKPGFHQGSRSFLPLETGSNRVNIQLLPMTQSGSFTASLGGTVTSGLLQLNFPANAVTLNGQPYTGTVRVYAAALDPTSTAMFDQMPGELLGGMNDSLRLLRSLGMASVELRDNNMNELQLANGVSATLRFNIPTAQQAEAPATIDWWSFDETFGYWKHEGEAIKQDSQYVAQASHFSWWNLDIPGTFNELIGNVISVGADPVSNAQIELISPSLGSVFTYTNSSGAFSGRIPKNETLTLHINLICTTTNDWALADSETIISEESNIYTDFTAELNDFFPVTGTLVNCENQPVVSGYVRLNNQVFLTQNGAFAIQLCATGDYEITGFDTSIPDSTKASVLDTIQVGTSGLDVGDIQACIELYGSVTDIDGNVYPTIKIGNQLWMAENLRTSSYANGDLIPNVVSSTAWDGLSTGAWCSVNNQSSNDALLGKLYNWYTTTDPRNVCPIGWHVPSDEEWNELIVFLDPSYVPMTIGNAPSAASGKLKSIEGWMAPNESANNQSGFSALPAGSRFEQDFFFGIGTAAHWWSSTVEFQNNAWYRRVVNNNDMLTRSMDIINSGFSIRCLQD